MNKEDLQELQESIDDLPEVMREAKRWLVWKAVPREGKKPSKVPYYANGSCRKGELDSPEDVVQLCSLQDAMQALESGIYAGLGFALGFDGSQYWQGVDLDGVNKRPELQYLADDLPGYTETSPSGNGAHAIGYGRKFDSLGSNESGIEAYSGKRYFTVTASECGRNEPVCLADYVEQVLTPRHGQRPHEEFLQETQEHILPPNDQEVRDLRSALNFMRADDRGLQTNQIGMALKTAGDIGRGLWLDWCSTSDKFDLATESRVWETLNPTNTHWRYVFTVAQERGWANVNSSLSIRKSTPRMNFELIPADELIANVRPPEWLIENLLEAKTLAMLFGQSGCGKSFMAIDWACCIATGKPWCECNVLRGAVIYIAGEGHGGLARRLAAWEQDNEQSLKGAPLHISKVAAQLMMSESADAVIAATDEIVEKNGPPNLIVVDTLARNIGPGDENSNADVSKFINALDNLRNLYNACVLIVHHTGHMEQKRARGASALRAAVDHEYQMEDRQGVITLTAHKMKEGETPEPSHFVIKSVELEAMVDTQSAVIVRSLEGPKQRKSTLTTNQIIGIKSYKNAAMKYGDLNEDGEFVGLHQDDWRKEFYALYPGDNQDSKKSAFRRVRADLCSRGTMSCRNDVYSLDGQTAAIEMQVLANNILNAQQDTGQERDNSGTCPGDLT